jgi:putative Holliday junction resolvase
MPVVLALDPGERRTGVAICDPTGTLASPLQTHDRRRDGSLIALLLQLVAQHHAERILIGLPLTQSGERGTSARHAERLARTIAAAVPVPVELFDERYTTAEAQRLLAQRAQQTGQRASREQRDALAAALLLQTWLDARRTAPPGDDSSSPASGSCGA